MRRWSVVFIALTIALASCGGGGGTSTTISGRSVQVSWPARTRGILTGPASALSVQITLMGAAADGSDVVLKEDRASGTAAYTGTYPIPGAVLKTATTLQATFYANASESGSVVATATANFATGQSNLPLTDIVLTGSVSTVTATPVVIGVGGTATQLAFTAKDSSGNVLALTPGSATWTAATQTADLTLTPDGLATGVAAGVPSVTATVDGVASAPADITVVAPTFTFPSGKGGQIIQPGFPAVEATLFKVTGSSDLTVTALGIEVVQAGQPAEQAAIFDGTTGAVLATVNVQVSGTPTGGYYWQSISPITLKAGSQYYIGALHDTGQAGSYIWNTHPATIPSYIQDLGTYDKITSVIDGNGSWDYGGGTSQYGSGELRHYRANFQAAPVGG